MNIKMLEVMLIGHDVDDSRDAADAPGHETPAVVGGGDDVGEYDRGRGEEGGGGPGRWVVVGKAVSKSVF